MVNEKLVSAHYDNEGLFGLISEGLRALGLNLDQITTTDLSPVDEFHLGGAEGTKFVIEELKKLKRVNYWMLVAGLVVLHAIYQGS